MATDITLGDLTNGHLNSSNEWDGSGVFDILISAVNKNIEGQYNKGRITSTDYATVYLGGLQSVIAQSMQYILEEKQVESQTDLLVTQKDELVKNGEKDRLLKDKELLNVQSEIDLRNTQKDELISDGDVKRAEIEAQTRLIGAQKDEKDYNLNNILPKQLDKLAKEIDFIDTQKDELALNGAKTRAVKDQDIAVKTNQAGLLDRQKKSLDDSLLKDLFKEASGGYAMVYDSLDSTPTPPGIWSDLDSLASTIKARVQS